MRQSAHDTTHHDGIKPCFQQARWRVLGLLLLGACLVFQINLEAIAKKASKADAAAASEDPAMVLAELDKTFDGTLVKVRSRMLLTPKDAQAMAAAKLKLMDLMTSTPNNPALVLPVYKAALLYAERDFPDDALELFEFLQVHFPNHPYSIRAAKHIEKLGGTAMTSSSSGKTNALPSGANATTPSTGGSPSAPKSP
ncbi:MAG: hypothetical protein VKK59_00845 [Vampirovibrionales bacterium]|nr:hypothetical protein [Vampirovibrionales bacterium]